MSENAEIVCGILLNKLLKKVRKLKFLSIIFLLLSHF